jgi:predicted metalloprotease
VVVFWGARFAETRRPFTPVRRIVPYHGDRGPTCGKERLSARNAAYCPALDLIGYDTDWVARMWTTIGDAFVYFLVGHEYGHAVQTRLGLTARFTITGELQADCFAGANLGRMVDDRRLAMERGDLEELFDSLGAVADQPGTGWFASGAHGSALQRRSAFFAGYVTSSVRACTTSW